MAANGQKTWSARRCERQSTINIRWLYWRKTANTTTSTKSIITKASAIRTWFVRKGSPTFWTKSSSRRPQGSEPERLIRSRIWRCRYATFCNRSGALQLVPGEGLAVNGALHCLGQDCGEKLAVRKSLQPQVQQKLRVFSRAFHAALQQKRQCRRNEINGQKDGEIKSQAFNAACVRAFRVEITSGSVFQQAKQKHNVNKRRHQRQHDLENNDVGQCNPAQAAAAANGSAMFPYGLQNAK